MTNHQVAGDGNYRYAPQTAAYEVGSPSHHGIGSLASTTGALDERFSLTRSEVVGIGIIAGRQQ